MKKLVYLFPAVIALGFAGCSDDAATADTEADTEDGTTDATDPTVTPTEPTASGSSSTTDPTIDPDTGGSDGSTTDAPGCDEDDQCTDETVEADCGANFECVACLCVPDGDAPLCPDGWGGGEYADCGSGEECGGELESVCVGGSNDASACLFLGCEDTCDCPAPPKGFEDLGRCEDQFGPGGMLDDINDCFLDCSGGESCPDNMFCDGGVCFVGEDPGAIPEYGDCLNEVGTCEDMGQCLSDGESFGACATNGCADASDCSMAPDTGDAEPTCTDLPDDGGSICTLGCSDGETCPDGMICVSLALGGADIGSHCMWPPVEAPEVGFDDCANNPEAVCLDGEVCVSDDAADPATAVCAQAGCTDPTTDCREVPPGGDAVAACAEIDDTSPGEECVVDCSGAEMCPTGMTCAAAGYCTWEDAGLALSEDFLPGVLPGGWLAIDVDGLPVAAQVAYISDAWVVSETVTPANPAVYSTSFYDPAGTSDDWLVTPAIALSATSVLSWDGMAPDMNFPDGYEVYVADATDLDLMDFVMNGDPTAFLAANTPVLTIAAEETMLTTRTLSAAAGEPLEGLVGSDVRVLWRNNSTDQFVLVLDNISVTP